MGNGYGCNCSNRKHENFVIIENRDIIGQYNNFINYGAFDLMVGRKIKREKGYEIEGSYVEKNFKCNFKGKITLDKVELEAEVNTLYNKIFTEE